MSYGVIYLHRNKVNGKVYVGQTTRKWPASRWGRKGQNYHHRDQPYMYHAIKKYGWDNFEHIIVRECETQQELNEAEIATVALYESANPEKGYNISPGGKGNGPLSEERKRRLSEVNTGKTHSPATRKKISEAHTGKKMSAETRAKMSAARRGKRIGPCPEERRKRISESLKGRKLPPETCRKMAERQMGVRPTEETRAKLRAARAKQIITEETKQKLREFNLGKTLSPEHRQKISEANKRRWEKARQPQSTLDLFE
jgi:group I intron endonuclease